MEEQRQQSQQIEQQKLEQAQQQFEIQTQLAEQKRIQEMENENMNKELDRQNRLQVEQLRGIAAEGSYSPTADTTQLLTEQTKAAMERSRIEFEKAVKRRELEQQDRKLDIEEKKAQDALEIAKLRDKGKLGEKGKNKK